MPFQYPEIAHIRRHGPCGYENYKEYKDWLRDEFSFLCVYCLVREKWYPNGQASFGVDHLIPKSKDLSLQTTYGNLVYSCNSCNYAKGEFWPIIDPCQEAYGDHLKIDETGEVSATSKDGAVLIDLLRLDDGDHREFRRNLLKKLEALRKAAATDPAAVEVIESLLGYPEALPDIEVKRPPKRNTRPEGVQESHYKARKENRLPRTY